MLQALVSTANRFLSELHRSLFQERLPGPAILDTTPPAPRTYKRLERVLLTDEVCRTLFEEYTAHRQSDRGEEETGWVLLGVREANEAVVLATLPAGAERSAGVSHVRFNASGQALASRIVRQWDRRLTMLGVVHTHPGSLRHPSDGDFQGDSQWVEHLRGREGIFGIGTADADPSAEGTTIAQQPERHMQCWGELCFCWYALLQGDRHYRPVPVALTLGPDLARPLHPVWLTIERYAEQLDRLCRQQAGVTFQVVSGLYGPALAVNLSLAEPNQKLRLIVEDKEVRYYLVRDGELLEVETHEAQVDRAVYLVLAELAAPG